MPHSLTAQWQSTPETQATLHVWSAKRLRESSPVWLRSPVFALLVAAAAGAGRIVVVSFGGPRVLSFIFSAVFFSAAILLVLVWLSRPRPNDVLRKRMIALIREVRLEDTSGRWVVHIGDGFVQWRNTSTGFVAVHPASDVDRVERFEEDVILVAGRHPRGAIPAESIGGPDPVQRVCDALGLAPPTTPNKGK